jgi:hypothetical protein
MQGRGDHIDGLVPRTSSKGLHGRTVDEAIMPSLQEVVHLLQASIEASVYIAPTEPGLTIAELYEIGKRLGLKDGEIGDALPQVATSRFGGRLILDESFWQVSGSLVLAQEPDLRSPAAFDFVVEQLNQLVREVGALRARLDRRIMIDRAKTQSIPPHDVEVAITLMLLSGQLAEDEGGLRFRSQIGGTRPLPSDGRNKVSLHRLPRPLRSQAMPHVKDVIDRRADGRPKNIEPFGAFSEQLEKLGHAHFRLWWTQTVAELGRTDPNLSPLSALVLIVSRSVVYEPWLGGLSYQPVITAESLVV